jgi:acyl-CoA synthetase (AMP-forming)/AMP-acid ligase II
MYRQWTLAEVPARRAAEHPSRALAVADDHSPTVDQLETRTDACVRRVGPRGDVQIAHGLTRTGPVPGDPRLAGAPDGRLTRVGRPRLATSLVPAGSCLSGDRGVGDEGRRTTVGRSRETMLRGGCDIHPHEVEDRLPARPAVGDVCVIGLRHGMAGELVSACIVSAEGAVITGEEIHDPARDPVAAYTIPDPARFRDAFPAVGSDRGEHTGPRAPIAPETTVKTGT